MVFLGLDWAEEHHDIAVLSEAGDVLGQLRIDDTMAGVSRIHELVAQHEADPRQVIVGTESAHGLVPQALVAAGYVVYEINPKAASRYRDRHHLSGAKSDRADAKMLADVVRTDRHNHRPYSGNSDLSEGIKVLARAHQSLIHNRQSQLNTLRSTLRQYYPGVLRAFPEFASPSRPDCRDALALLALAPTPAQARALSLGRITSALRMAGRERFVERRATEIHEILSAPQLEAPPLMASAYGSSVQASARVISTMTQEIDKLGKELESRFEQHPDAKIIRSLPGLGPVLGARALGEFGDDPKRYVDASARKNYATTSPVTKASGKTRHVAARCGGNRQLGETCRRWAMGAVQTSPGARRYYQTLRARDKTHAQALCAVANRLVGILHGCLIKRQTYNEEIAWPLAVETAAA